MAIETYKTDEARELLERIGMPTWNLVCADSARHLIFRDGRWEIWKGWPTGSHVYTTSHIALCLLRNYLREWLQKYHAAVIFTHVENGNYAYIETASGLCRMFDDYDEALLAAAEKAEKGTK